MAKHRHKFVVTRFERMTKRPMIKKCSCGRAWRYRGRRWVLTNVGRP